MVIRIKLFLFYSLMAWASVYNPEHGKQMIDAAQAGEGEGPIKW